MMLLSLLLLPLLSLAAPSPQSPTAQTNHHHHGEDLYYIRTTDSEKPSYNNLYISAYHTGAGLNDAVAQASKENAAKGFLNETYQQFAFGTDFPWGMVIGSTANYARKASPFLPSFFLYLNILLWMMGLLMLNLPAG